MTSMATTITTPSSESLEELSAEIIAQLRQRAAGGRDERPRQSHRFPWKVELAIKVQNSPVNGGELKLMTITTMDISAGGFGFKSDRFIYPGTRIYAELPMRQRSMVEGEVRYCVHQTGTAHRIGVKFLQLIRLD